MARSGRSRPLKPYVPRPPAPLGLTGSGSSDVGITDTFSTVLVVESIDLQEPVGITDVALREVLKPADAIGISDRIEQGIDKSADAIGVTDIIAREISKPADPVGVTDISVSEPALNRPDTEALIDTIDRGVDLGQGDIEINTDSFIIWMVAKDLWDVTGITDSVTAGIVSAPPVLLAEYGFIEGSGTTSADTSGNGRTATLNAGASWTTWQRNSAIQGPPGFQTDIVTVPLTGLETIRRTMMCWAKASDTTIQYAVRMRNSGDSGVWGILPVGTAGTDKVTFRIKIGGNNYDVHAFNGGTNWTHYAMTYDATTFKAYVNGVLVGSNSVTGTIDAASGFFDMTENSITVDDVRLYHGALDQTEIQTLMNTPVGPWTVRSSDPVGITDTFSVSYVLEKIDAIGITDAFSVAPDKRDNETITDLFERSYSEAIVPDSADITDIAVVRISATEFSDLVVLPATATPFLSIGLNFSDSLGITDQINAAIVAPIDVPLADAIGLTDSVSIARDLGQTDSVGLTDAITLDKALAKDYSDTVGITDTSLAEVSYARNFPETAGITDSITLLVSKNVVDAIAVAAPDVRSLLFDKAVPDAVGLTDVITSVVNLLATERPGITDLAVASTSKALSDTAGLADSIDRAMARSYPDSAGIADTFGVSAAGAGTFSDTVPITDEETELVSKALDDRAGITDIVSTERLLPLSKSDQMAITDVIFIDLSKAQNYIDLESITDSIQPFFTRGITDTAGITDLRSTIKSSSLLAVSPTDITDSTEKSFVTLLIDSIGLTDSIFANLIPPVSAGKIKVWDGIQHTPGVYKWWDGSTWQIDPTKTWNGTTWETVS